MTPERPVSSDPSRPHEPRFMPSHHPDEAHKSGVGGKSGALRAGIFGINDGLVSNLALIMGIAGATGAKPSIVVLAGVAGLLAGAFSMGAGEFVSMRVQRDLFENLLNLERWELEHEAEEELAELAAIYEAKGLPPALASEVATTLSKDPEIALQTHAREELGLDPDDLGSPSAAAVSSFFAFTFGAIVPLFPFFFLQGNTAILLSSILSGGTLFLVGSLMTMWTGKHFWLSGLRMLAVGGAAASLTFLIGNLFNVQGI